MHVYSVTAAGNEITFHHSHESTSPLADYDGYSITVNGNVQPITYSSGDPDWQIKFTRSAGDFADGDVLVGFYVAAGNDMQEVGGGHLIDSDTSLDPFTVVVAPTVNDPPVIGVLNLPNAVEGQNYSYFIPYAGVAETFSLVTGTLPAWLGLDLNTGEFAGAPAIGDPDIPGISVSVTNPSGTSATSNIDTLSIVAAGTGFNVVANFEAGSEGQVANGVSGLFGALSQTVYSTERSNTGTKSAKATINAGTNGSGDFGFNQSLPEKLHEGDELWCRAFISTKSPWNNWDIDGQSSEGPKGIRFRVERQDGSGGGYWNFNPSTSGMLVATSVVGDDFYDNHPWPDYTHQKLTGVLPVDQQMGWEFYVRFHSQAGQGIVRAWFNGILIFEDVISPTMKEATDKVVVLQIFSYWRGGSGTPDATQSLFIDNVRLTDNNPGSIDSNGNPYIGLN